ncbi:MAG: hypothetical protein RR595_12135 [Lysinibacillus sp.]
MNFCELKENYTKVLPSHVGKVTPDKKTKIPVFEVLAVAGIVAFGFPDISFAAGTALQEKAESLYYDTFIGIAKWVIILKGGWDIVTRTLKEDFDGAKRGVLQYALIFCVLMGLPAALGLVEEFFKEV